MPPRGTGQLDEISEAIGELKGSVKSIESYVHEGRHGVNNLSQEVKGLGTLITREIAAVEERMKVRFEQVEQRLVLLEAVKNQQIGAKNLTVAVLQSPLIGWLVAIAAVVAAWWKGRI